MSVLLLQWASPREHSPQRWGHLTGKRGCWFLLILVRRGGERGDPPLERKRPRAPAYWILVGDTHITSSMLVEPGALNRPRFQNSLWGEGDSGRGDQASPGVAGSARPLG